ncbi:cell division protein SepF [bacterium 1XD8-76]|nr:cell division protein SepF [bacterium 1XD8-76]
MGALDNFLKILQLNEEDEDGEYYDDDYYDDEDEITEPAPRKKAAVVKESNISEVAEEKTVKKTVPKITPMKPRKVNAGGMEVCVIKPTSVEDGREITETLLANRTVVLNLEGLDMEIAQRIIDFTSGSCFAISGNLQKISHYIFIVTPPSVDISGDFQEIMGSALDMPI